MVGVSTSVLLKGGVYVSERESERVILCVKKGEGVCDRKKSGCKTTKWVVIISTSVLQDEGMEDSECERNRGKHTET